jgi:hypothetical protein
MNLKELRRLAMEGLKARLSTLQAKTDEVKRQMTEIGGKKKPSPLKGRRKMTSAERKAISKRMKAFHRKKKAEVK